MATNNIRGADWVERFRRMAREWWPAVILPVGALLTQHVLLSSRYDVGGHAAEHLGSASAPFMAAAVVAVLLWATPRARHQLDVIAALVLVAAFRWRRHIGSRAAVGLALVTVLFPPWIIPGAGVIVRTVMRCAAHRRERNVSDFASQSENRSTAPLPQEVLNSDA
jgi:hypothetical protein